ncbi:MULTISPECIES: peptidoglycan DD-metalloendopeptidase family protein [Flavobacterium]|uniref:M23 family metallopeptidase n=1 Tax=Flavobacterium TaxID=237 RepID=UPI00086971E5|nr:MULTISPECIES: peptidoglycan DD-metalloendopeptidase family protein [Flavobacterium]MBN9284650.1 peptidoglycan DD-metalloendopeptidase family protein [Flavobacterium sp.]ODS84741.1 MAG: peptidase M23 [Chryseobacterium sp. SCN 40-13]OJV72602.1 MAG: peptidase M23 [Flavobacterium sp. 40-81]
MKYIAIILLLTTLFACNKKEEKQVKETKVKKEKILVEYGFTLNDFKVVNDTIKSGDSFGKILGAQNFDAAKIHEITEKVKDSFNVRDIRIGKPYTLLQNKTAPHDLKVFIYQPDRMTYYVVDLRDSIAVHKKQRPVTIKRRTIAAAIDGSVSETLKRAGVDASLAPQLSRIYAWSIDFFKIQKGDKFAVTINEKYISDTIYAGVESIDASYFEYKGKKVYAFPFKQDPNSKRVDYFDEEGKVLKNMFLKAPLKFVNITSRFTKSRFHPVQLKWKAHNGTDYAAPTGTPIMTTASGVVERTGYTAGNGNFVKVKHNGTFATQYLHMSKILVRQGQRVQQGDVIGRVGSTGLATGPHVCYRFWKNGIQVDPLRQKLPNSEPMSSKYKARYMEYIKPLKKELDSVSIAKFGE